MGKFIFGIFVGVILVPLAVWAYLASGSAPAATADKPLPFEAQITGMALRARIQKEAPTRDLSTLTTADLLQGADVYKKNCAVCHGLPDQPENAIAQGMFPPVPQFMAPPRGRGGERGPGRPGGPPPGFADAQKGLVKGRGASGDFWRVKYGIRLTGMPAFEKNLSDDQMWDVVALLAARRNMPQEVRDALKPEPAAPASTPAPTAPPVQKGPASNRKTS